MAHQGTRRALLALALIALCATGVFADDGSPAPLPDLSASAAIAAWLVPIGMGLVACGAVPTDRVATVIRLGWLALGAGTVVYWLCGFAFQFGGVGFVASHPDLAGLVRLWSWEPLNASWGTEWGVIGLTGYRLLGPAATPAARALFFAQLPWITTAVAVPLWALQGRARPVTLLLSALLSALIYSLLGNWLWGGGWLASLGVNVGLGGGFRDTSGASVVHLAGAAISLAGMLAFGTRAVARSPVRQLPLPDLAGGSRRDSYTPMPPLHLPLMGTLGAWLALIGCLGWLSSTPAQILGAGSGSWVETGIALLLAAAGGAVASLAISWLTTGEGNALMVARAALGSAIAIGPSAGATPHWVALAVGGAAGVLVPVVQYLVDHVLRLDDPTSAIATHGVPALGGLLVVGLLDQPSQLRAQAMGLAAVALAAFLLSWLLFALVQALTQAWHGEYTIRLPKRARAPRTRRRAALSGPRVRFVRERAAPADDPPPAPERTSAGRRIARWIAARVRRRSGEQAPTAQETLAEAPPTPGDERAPAETDALPPAEEG